MTTNTNIGSALGALRAFKGKSLAHVAKELSISPTTYSGYEHGQSLPDVGVLLHASIYYQINIEFLLFLLCVDVSAMEKIDNIDFFQSFSYSYTFPWNFFQMHERYKKLPERYQFAIRTFTEAAEQCQENPPLFR